MKHGIRHKRVSPKLAVSLSKLVAKERRQEKWIVDKLIRKGDVVEIVEQAKGGKTTFLVQLLASIMRGRHFLRKATLPTKIAYLGSEDRPADLERLFKAHGVHSRTVLVSPDISKYSLPSPGDRNLNRVITQASLGLITLDPITDFINQSSFGREGFNENDAMHWKRIIDVITSTARQTKAVAVLIRHKGKAMCGGRGSYSISPSRGSNYPESKVNVVMNLTKYGKAGWKLVIHGKGISTQDIWLRSGDGRYTFKVGSTGGRKPEQKPQGKNGQQTADGLRKFIIKKGGEVSGWDMQAELKRLRVGGIIVPMRGKGLYRLLKQIGADRRRSGGRTKIVLNGKSTQQPVESADKK